MPDSTNPLNPVTPLQRTITVSVTPTVTASNSYGTNYVVGGLLTFQNLFYGPGSGILQNVTITMKKTEASGFTFFIFSSQPSNTTWTDAAVAAINAADINKVLLPISLSANSQLAASGFTVWNATNLAQGVSVGSSTMYAVLLANATLTNQFGSTSDVTVSVTVLPDLV